MSVNFAHVISVHSVAPRHPSTGFHLLRELQQRPSLHAGPRTDVHLNFVDRQTLCERGRGRVVQMLREGQPASWSLMNSTPADESQVGFVGMRGRPAAAIAADGH